MKEYKIRKTGIIVTGVSLDEFEEVGMSEERISNRLGISRQMLHRIRIKLGCMQKVRSDKGKKRG